MILVDVGDQNQIGPGQFLEPFPSADRIDIDRLVFPLHDEGGVIDRVDHQITVVGGDPFSGHRWFRAEGKGGQEKN